MSETADIVVAGAGHNSLITAAYLAKAGYDVLVLDARPLPGGGASSEELLLPGYLIDTCATGHTLIQVNPLLLRDELGLRSRYGLQYISPDPVAQVAFPDGRHLTTWLDLDRTCEEIARYSKADAAAYRRLIAEYDEVKELFAASRFTPVGFGPSLEEMLWKHPRGRVWLRRCRISSWDVIRSEFESRHIRAYLAWQAIQTGVPIDTPGSGPLAYSIVFSRQRRGWMLPLGGSGKLVGAITACIAENGGRIVCNRRVARLVLENGRCIGVETTDGERYLARKAVVSTIHVKHLVEMAPPEAWGEDFLYGVRTYDIGVATFGIYLLTTEPPVFATPDGPRSAVSAGLAGWPEEMIALGRALRDVRYSDQTPWMLVATPTLADASRAPHGHHTVKLLTMQSWALPEGETSWEAVKRREFERQLALVARVAPNFTADKVLASLVRSPDDFEAANPHMIHGTIHGGARDLAQSGAMRPVPGWGQHRMPIPGLYQTGGTTHPGGSITGAPGRNAAIVLLRDLGHSLEEVVGRAQAAPATKRGA
jgi:phytoene dehydrogenase-like protein